MLECHDVAVSGSGSLKIPKSCGEKIIGGDSTRLDRIMDSCRSLIGKSRSRSTKQDHVLLCYCSIANFYVTDVCSNLPLPLKFTP